MSTLSGTSTAIARRPLVQPTASILPAALGTVPVNARSAIQPTPQAPEPFVFEDIETWPNLDEALRQTSLELLSKVGVNNWKFTGGVVAPDGHPTLGSPSSEALEIVTRIINQSGRFRYRDEAGVEWAVLVTEDRPGEPGLWQGIALGCTGRIAVLSRRDRLALLKQVTDELIAVSDARVRQTSVVRKKRAQLTYVRRWLTGLETAAKLVTTLYTAARVHQRIKVDSRELACEAWGDSQLDWPTDWRSVLHESLAMIGSLEVQSVQMPKTGWKPKSWSRQPASLGVGWVDTRIIELRWSPIFISFLGEWLSSGKPAATYANRYGTIIRKHPQEVDLL